MKVNINEKYPKININTCCLSFGHNGDCICKIKLEHLCDYKCKFFKKAKGCEQSCNKTYGHFGEHLCSSLKHICQRECYYFGKCKGKCDKFCFLEYGHKDICICRIEDINDYHICNKNCSCYGESRGCNKECCKKIWA